MRRGLGSRRGLLRPGSDLLRIGSVVSTFVVTVSIKSTLSHTRSVSRSRSLSHGRSQSCTLSHSPTHTHSLTLALFLIHHLTPSPLFLSLSLLRVLSLSFRSSSPTPRFERKSATFVIRRLLKSPPTSAGDRTAFF